MAPHQLRGLLSEEWATGRLTQGTKPFKTSGLTAPLETTDEEPPSGGWLKEQPTARMRPSPGGEVETGRLRLAASREAGHGESAHDPNKAHALIRGMGQGVAIVKPTPSPFPGDGQGTVHCTNGDLRLAQHYCHAIPDVNNNGRSPVPTTV